LRFSRYPVAHASYFLVTGWYGYAALSGHMEAFNNDKKQWQLDENIIAYGF
jgi:hypothetical protein